MLRPHQSIYEEANDGQAGGGGGGGAPAAKGVSPEEVTRLVEKARAEEKAKLYEELNQVRGQNEKLAAQVSDLTKKLEETTAQFAKLSGEHAALVKAASTDGKVNVEALIREVTETQARELQKVTGEKIQSVESELSRLRSENQSMKISQYKAKKISEAGGNIVTSLVTGSTEAEIDQSVELAKREYQAIADRIKNVGNPGGQGSNQPSGAAGAPPVLPSNENSPGGGATPNVLDNANLSRSKSPREYGSEREKKLAILKQRYG